MADEIVEELEVFPHLCRPYVRVSGGHAAGSLDHGPVPRARDDGAVLRDVEGAYVLCVAEEREAGLALGAREREDVDDRVLASRDRVAWARAEHEDEEEARRRLPKYVPSGAPGAGGRYATALMKREPARRVDVWAKAAGDDLDQEIAVESREAERIRSSVGATTALT